MKKRNIDILVDEGFSNDYKTFLEMEYEIGTITSFQEYKKSSGNIPFSKIDLIVFTGGEDVNPELYNEMKGSRTSINIKRDELANLIYSSLRYSGIPMLGICRGSQFLCVKNGGKLIQHVDNHTSSHDCEIIYHGLLTTFKTTSTHHQMMYPFNLKENLYNLLSWSKYFLGTTYLNGIDEEIEKHEQFLEPEILYFKDTKSLAVQGHPEFSSATDQFKEIVHSLIKEYLFNK